MPPTAATVCDGTAADYAAIGVGAGHGFGAVVPPKGVALAQRVAHQTVVVTQIEIQPFVLVVLMLTAVLSPTSLLQDHHRKARRGQLFGHNATAGSGADDHEIDRS